LLSLWSWRIGHLPSQQWLHEGLQDRDPTLDRSLPFLEQRQRELGELLLKRHDLGFQADQFLDQVRLQARREQAANRPWKQAPPR